MQRMGRSIEKNLVTTAAMGQEGDLVRHGSRSDEQGAFLAQEVGNHFTELNGGRILAFDFITDLGDKHSGLHLCRRAGNRIAPEVDPRLAHDFSPDQMAFTKYCDNKVRSTLALDTTPRKVHFSSPFLASQARNAFVGYYPGRHRMVSPSSLSSRLQNLRVFIGTLSFHYKDSQQLDPYLTPAPNATTSAASSLVV
jgi:hypothetical protein